MERNRDGRRKGSSIKQYQTWLETVRHPLSFGAIACYLGAQRIEVVRHLVYEDTLLETFAYSCERLGSNGKSPAAEVEPLLESRAVASFFWRDDRPTIVKACDEATLQWCLPLSTLVDPIAQISGLKLTDPIERSVSIIARVHEA